MSISLHGKLFYKKKTSIWKFTSRYGLFSFTGSAFGKKDALFLPRVAVIIRDLSVLILMVFLHGLQCDRVIDE